MAAVKSDADAAAACQTIFGNPADAVALTTYKGDTANLTWKGLVGSPASDFGCSVLPAGAN